MIVSNERFFSTLFLIGEKEVLYKREVYSLIVMKKLTDLQYLKLNWIQKLGYNIAVFFVSIPGWFAKLGKNIWNLIKKFGIWIKDDILDIFNTFKNGNWAIKLSFVIMGLGNLVNGQVLRGILFLLFEIVFFVYLFIPSGGIHWISKCQFFTNGTIGTEQGHQEYHEIYDTQYWVPGDDSTKVLLYGLISIIFILAFIYTWRIQIKQCSTILRIKESGGTLKSTKDDLKSMVDEQFHKTLLALPVLGITMFTVLPIIFMILIAFTSFDATADGYSNLYSWVGWDNFNTVLDFGSGGLGLVFGELLSWTLIWSIFATFTNYFLGMAVAMLINKKGIKFKKVWRTILVMTIAIPQFVSLLYVARLFDSTGAVGSFLLEHGLIPSSMLANNQRGLWENPTSARILVIVINIWIGIPYVMLMASGILMNIPQDLYESAKIDGANPWQQFTRITLPYMLFVTGPYLLTSFVGNLNNFNVIYLLTGGNPLKTNVGAVPGSVGETDLLITWLFKITTGSTSDYKTASVVGILIFLVVAILSLIVYNIMPSNRNEEDFR